MARHGAANSGQSVLKSALFFQRFFGNSFCGSQVNQKLQIHGWPDISAGWRYQVPLFLEHGFRVVCPDLMGFGMTVRSEYPFKLGGGTKAEQSTYLR